MYLRRAVEANITCARTLLIFIAKRGSWHPSYRENPCLHLSWQQQRGLGTVSDLRRGLGASLTAQSLMMAQAVYTFCTALKSGTRHTLVDPFDVPDIAYKESELLKQAVPH